MLRALSSEIMKPSTEICCGVIEKKKTCVKAILVGHASTAISARDSEVDTELIG